MKEASYSKDKKNNFLYLLGKESYQNLINARKL